MTGAEPLRQAVAYTIETSREVPLDLTALTIRQQKDIRDSIPRYLRHEPGVPSHKRKPLDPNPFGAGWELRLGDLRVLYDIDEPAQTVRVLRAGRKVGNQLYLRGAPVETRRQ